MTEFKTKRLSKSYGLCYFERLIEIVRNLNTLIQDEIVHSYKNNV